MLNFSAEPTRRNATFNQFSTTFRRIFNPILNGRKTKDLDKNLPNHSKSKLIEECKNSKVHPASTDHPIEILNSHLLNKECPICFLQLPLDSKPLECGHTSCDECLIRYLKTEISESRIAINCPECSIPIHPNRISELLSNDPHLLNKYEEFSIRKVLITDPETRWCPSADCGYAVIGSSSCSQCPVIHCEREGCGTLFCYLCQKKCTEDHKCKKSKSKVKSTRKLNKKTKSSSKSDKQLKVEDKSNRDDLSSEDMTSSSEVSTEEFLNKFNMKQCPSCKILIIKVEDGSCNHMSCGICNTQFCWLCTKKTSELHYLSPTGCTFFGKKQWSKKKKLGWQFGMLFGAPVFIMLSAAIAVPSIIIAVPVFCGRKLQKKLSGKRYGKFKKCAIMTSAVVGSAIVSPVLAAGAIAIGVPFLLAYTYGIVPLTLLRSKAQANNSKEEPTKISEEEVQFLSQLSIIKDTQINETTNRKSRSKERKSEKNKSLKLSKSARDATIEDRSSSTKAQFGSSFDLNDETDQVSSSSSSSSNKYDKLSFDENSDFKISILHSADVNKKKEGNSKLVEDLKIEVQIHSDVNGKRFLSSNKKKLEVKSLENLNLASYCEVCEIEHLPCCPNSMANSGRLVKK